MIKENERFLIFVEQIKTIKSYLEKLNCKGYPKNIDIIIEINQGEISPKIVNINKEYTSLEELTFLDLNNNYNFLGQSLMT